MLPLIDMFHNEPGVYELYKADTSAIRFQVRYPNGTGFACFTLTAKENPKKDLYQVFFGPTYRFVDITKNGEHESKRFTLSEPIGSDFREFWMTWHSGVICMGESDRPNPILVYTDHRITRNNIGFIKFFIKSARWPVEWFYEASPVVLKSVENRKIEGGIVDWVEVDSNSPFPDDALIAGFENEQPLYVARARINGSLCVGKYLRSKRRGYFPWGGRQYVEDEVELLTGYNVKWVKTKGACIPENAVVGGYSEVRREPLYIGRAMYENNLLVGKVHVLYKACYFAHRRKEVEVSAYEIMVRGDLSGRGELAVDLDEKHEHRPPRQLVL
ncbi:uncharacterized protein LOC126372310 [Pectinophora gossypiella]|uniref:Farnesoic acid O-methyl transferase domain-containing protein n=1 Tax=Pectinophora gossypiella TaxID=13191 RepID=A0A1E1WA32_PECGO|nr:uncharacterized protein LOC126372310 [Pectinophora gossypiella]